MLIATPRRPNVSIDTLTCVDRHTSDPRRCRSTHMCRSALLGAKRCRLTQSLVSIDTKCVDRHKSSRRRKQDPHIVSIDTPCVPIGTCGDLQPFRVSQAPFSNRFHTDRDESSRDRCLATVACIPNRKTTRTCIKIESLFETE